MTQVHLVWVVLGLLAVGAIGVGLVVLLTRRRGAALELAKEHRDAARREANLEVGKAEAEGATAVNAADAAAAEEVSNATSTGSLGSHLSDLNRRSGSD